MGDVETRADVVAYVGRRRRWGCGVLVWALRWVVSLLVGIHLFSLGGLRGVGVGFSDPGAGGGGSGRRAVPFSDLNALAKTVTVFVLALVTVVGLALTAVVVGLLWRLVVVVWS